MKSILFSIVTIIFFSQTSNGQCYQNAAPAFSFSFGTYKTGAVIAIEGYSWGIDRNTFFGAGISGYNQDKIFTHPETKEETLYKETVADAYAILGVKLAKDSESRFFTTLSGSASVKGNLAANLGFYYQAGELILIGVQPGYQSLNGLGVSFKTIFRF